MLNKQLGSISVHCLNSDSFLVKQWRSIGWLHMSYSWRSEINYKLLRRLSSILISDMHNRTLFNRFANWRVARRNRRWGSILLAMHPFLSWPELHVQTAVLSRPTSPIPMASGCLPNISSRRKNWSIAAEKAALTTMWGWIPKVSLINGRILRGFTLFRMGFRLFGVLPINPTLWHNRSDFANEFTNT